MADKRRKKNNEEIPKKQCRGENCGKLRSYDFFLKVDSPLFPDGMIDLCRECVRKQVDIENVESVIRFLRQIDKPFVKKYWDTAYGNYISNGKQHPLGAYMRMVNGLSKDKSFDDTKGMTPLSKSFETPKSSEISYTENLKGEPIEFDERLIAKWGEGYESHEYLKMEKFYQDMRLTHEIHTPVHVNKLMELAYLTIVQERLRNEGQIGDYTKLAAAIDKMETSAGFSPKDRQSIDDATGIRSFSQIFEEVEKKGFRKPPPLVFDEDAYDIIITSLGNYYHRMFGKQILSEVPEELKEELNEFFQEDLTPVEINEEDYENIDYSLDDEESDTDD